MKTFRAFLIGSLLCTLFLATPQGQQSIISLTSAGWLVGAGNAVPLLLGSNGKGFLRITESGAISTINSATMTLPSSAVLTTPVIDGVTYSAANDKQSIVTTVTLSGATIHAGVFTAWTAPADAIIDRLEMDITTASTGASTLDCGYTATTATTASDTLLDGVSGTPAALFDSMNAALDSGANAKAQKAASAKWITCGEASGDTTGLVGKLYVYYHTL